LDTKLYLVMTILVGVAVVVTPVYSVWQFESEVFPGCSLRTPHGCASWVWNYSKHLRNHPH
jgi:hypothetical protein